MYTAEEITTHCGPDAAVYAANKNRGGRNNAQGSAYENYYATARIIALLADALEHADDGYDTWIDEQNLCFVDDLVIQRAAHRRLSQLKSGATSWTSGDHPIADDFRLQDALDRAVNVEASYELVVSDAAQRDSLDQSRPEDLAVDIVRFSAARELDALFSDHPELADAIDRISIHEPRPSVRRQVFITLLGDWMTTTGRTRLSDIAERASAQPGPLVSVLGPEYELPAEVAEHLRGIGMDFEIRKKHLFYRFGLLQGYSAFRGGTPEFTAFERFIVEKHPEDPFEVIAVLRGGA